MLSCVSAWILMAALAQAPAATAPRALLIENVPADTPVVLSFSTLDKVRADLDGMLRAMSPNLAQIGPVLTIQMAQFTAQFGAEAAKTPFTVALELPATDGDSPTMAILLPIEDYQTFLKSVASGNTEALGNGVDKFKGKLGDMLLAFDGPGFVVFGNQDAEALIKKIALKPAATIGSKLSAELKAALLGGDFGLYVNMVTVQDRYKDQIGAMREQIMAALDQAADQLQQNDQMDQAKKLYGAMFDAANQADGLALNFDFDKQALDLSAFLSLRANTPTLARLKDAKTGTAEGLAKLPPGYLVYGYLNTDPKTTEGLARMNSGALFPGSGNGNPGAEKYFEAIKELGRQESLTAMSYGDAVDVIALATPENAEKSAHAMLDMMKAMTQSPGVKKATVEENVENYKGFALNRANIEFDFQKMLGDQANNPATAGILRAMLGDQGGMTSYFGTNGKQLISTTAKNADEAHTKIDRLFDPAAGIGNTPGYQTLRDRLPKETNALFALNAQALVRFIGRVIGVAAGGDPIAPAADMPAEMAMLGGSLATYPTGYRLDFVIPTAVGPVMEKGLMPMIQGIQGQVNQ